MHQASLHLMHSLLLRFVGRLRSAGARLVAGTDGTQLKVLLGICFWGSPAVLCWLGLVDFSYGFLAGILRCAMVWSGGWVLLHPSAAWRCLAAGVSLVMTELLAESPTSTLTRFAVREWRRVHGVAQGLDVTIWVLVPTHSIFLVQVLPVCIREELADESGAAPRVTVIEDPVLELPVVLALPSREAVISSAVNVKPTRALDTDQTGEESDNDVVSSFYATGS